MEEEISTKIQLGEELLVKLKSIHGIDGAIKLQDQIRREIDFLKKLQNTNKVKMNQVSSSKIGLLTAMVECALRPGVVAVCKQIDPKLVVDIISEEGKVWTKVVNRNPKYQSYGNILEQAKMYLKGALINLCMDEPPKVIFEFTRAVEEGLANKLKALDVVVEGEIFTESSSESSYDNYYDSDGYWCSD